MLRENRGPLKEEVKNWGPQEEHFTRLKAIYESLGLTPVEAARCAIRLVHAKAHADRKISEES